MGRMPGPPMPDHVDSMMSLLPGWVRLVWVIAMAVVAVVHIWHGATMAGQPRWWHAAHTAMAVGMLAMYAADPMRQRGLDRAFILIFAIITLAIAAATVLLCRREDRPNPLWVATGVDTAAMMYMATVMASPSTAPRVVTWIVVAYLVCQTFAWLLGLWDRVLAHRPSLGLADRISIDIRISLAVMAAGMAYMLAAMTS
jgi:hypothetical protein